MSAQEKEQPTGAVRWWWVRRAVAVGACSAALLLLPGRVLSFHLPWLLQLFWTVPALAAMAWYRHVRGPAPGSAPDREAAVLAGVLFGALALYLFSSATDDNHFYFLRWAPHGTELRPRSDVARLCLLTGLLTPLFLFWRRRTWVLVLALLVYGWVMCVSSLGHVTQWKPLYRDDHPAFMYRLWVFAQTFPRLTYYDPLWNAGKVSAHLVASGVTPLGLLALPFLKVFPILQIYTPLLALAFIIVVPLLALTSARIAGAGWAGAGGAAILAMGVNQLFFTWLLHFGAAGSSFVVPFIMPVSACLYRVLWLDRREWWVAPVLIVSSLMFLSWPLAWVFAAAIVPAILFSARVWTRRKLLFLGACGAVLALGCAPLVAGIAAHSANPARFAEISVTKFEFAHALAHGWDRLLAHLRQANPVLVFFGCFGLWFLPARGVRAFFGPAILTIALFAGWGEEWKPLLQLTRAGIPMFFLAALPTALWMDRCFAHPSYAMAPLRAALAGLLLLTVLHAGRLYGNNGPAPYAVMSGETVDMVEWIRNATPADARIAFAGVTVHGYGRGHVTLLPAITGRAMMAADYVHFSPQLVEYEYPPREFLQDDPTGFDFMDLYNVSHVFTFHDNWKAMFRSHPERYEEMRSFGPKGKRTVFRVRRVPNAFVQGSGHVRAAINRLDVTVDDPDQETVLRYNWVDGLHADAPVTMRPFDAGRGVQLIAVQPHGQRAFTLRYRKWL